MDAVSDVDPARAQGVTCIDPATGERFAEHSYLSTADVERLLDTASKAFVAWRETPAPARAQVLRRVADTLRRHAEAHARDMVREMGKPITQARAEVAKCADLCDWYAEQGAGLLADEPAAVGRGRAMVAFRPLGAILGVMPWNFPFWQPMRALVPILTGGNAFVLKPAPACVGSAKRLAEAFEGAGAPFGLVSLLNVPDKAIASVIADKRIAGVTLTGSVRAGAAVAAEAGRALKKTVLELGGSDPFIVLADADLERAVKAAVEARFQNNGEICIAAKRIILEAPIAAAFTERFIEAVKALKLGDPMQDDTYIGPMARRDLRDALVDQVRRTVEAGAAVLLEGGVTGPERGAFYAPTILGGVRPGMAAFEEETFGPVAALVEAADADDALRLANASDFGLSGAIWSGNTARAEVLASRLETGGVFVNGVAASDPRTPIGGVKSSGYGRELSYFGLREFTNAQLVWTDRG